MKNLIRDIEENCKECACENGKTNLEKTIQFLYKHSDISSTSEYYREIWFFYQEALKMFKAPNRKLQARRLTLEHFKISYQTFKKVRKRIKVTN